MKCKKESVRVLFLYQIHIRSPYWKATITDWLRGEYVNGEHGHDGPSGREKAAQSCSANLQELNFTAHEWFEGYGCCWSPDIMCHLKQVFMDLKLDQRQLVGGVILLLIFCSSKTALLFRRVAFCKVMTWYFGFSCAPEWWVLHEIRRHQFCVWW